MSEYATNGAMIVCTCGSAPGNLQVTSNLTVSAQGQPIATVSDKAPMANIPVFGTCTMKPSISGFLPCVPAPTAWSGFVASVNLPGGNPLLKTSMLQCGCGGMISFQDSGQKKSAKVVVNPSSAQIAALEKAAILAVPFCEECEQRKRRERKIRAVDVYWMEKGENERYYETFPENEVTLYIETIDYTEGEVLTLNVSPTGNRLFKGGKDKMTIQGKADANGIVIIKNFCPEYEE